jgi:acyl-coenzyme A thioesterase PaaI-like protein
VNFLRPVLSATGEVDAEGTVLHAGKSQAVVERACSDGRLYALASTKCAILR